MRRIPIIPILRGLFQRQQPVRNIETGSTESIVTGTYIGGQRGNERRFSAVRDPHRARRLEAIATLPEAATAIDIISRDCFSSQDGDDLGFVIPETMADGTRIDPQVIEIGNACIDRIMRGDSLKIVAQEMLEGGDSFRSMIINSSRTEIMRLKELPAWEMFRVENDDGLVERFEQRKWMDDVDSIVIHPIVCTHWRFRRNSLYGRALFEEMFDDSRKLARGHDSLDRAVISAGTNANIHTMPTGTDATFLKQYKREHERRIRQGETITDYYMLPSQAAAGVSTTNVGQAGTVIKMATSWNPDLSGLLNNIDKRERRFAMKAQMPPYLLGLVFDGAQDISGQPAMAYARFINGVRSDLSEGIRHILNVEFALKGIFGARYRLKWPKIITSQLEQMSGTAGAGDETEITSSQSEDVIRLPRSA